VANFGRRPITNADKPRPIQNYIYAGEERIDRRPQGKVERFVDKEGNVVSIQLAGDGDSRAFETATRIRRQQHIKGSIEHAKCPLRHGTHLTAGRIQRDFSLLPENLREPCAADKKTLVKRGGEIHAVEGCPHVEWLIAERRRQHQENYEKRNHKQIEAERREADKRELEDLKLAAEREALLAQKRGGKSKP
jgi:hypothetical protein